MCGIVGYTGARAATPVLLDGLRRLEYRGYDSAGVAVVDGATHATQIIRREGKISRLSDDLDGTDIPGGCGLGHTRWATHGRPSEANAHPHRQGKVSVVHNGIIENHFDLRRELEEAGCTFDSETDTEIFAHLIDRAMQAGESSLDSAVAEALAVVRGTWALCVIHDDHPDQIVAARHGTPLLVGLADTKANAPEMFVASDVAAILSYTQTVVDLEDGDVASVRPDGVQIRDANRNAIERPSRTIDWNPVAAEKGGYPHFMLKEIHEQPTAFTDTLMGRVSPATADVNLDGIDLKIPSHGRLVFIACGTSWHAALAAKYLIEGLARVRVEVDLASEFRYRNPLIGEQDLVVAISQSGETADTLAALGEAKRRGASSLAICNVVGSSIARMANNVLYTHAGPEISVASTKAFTTQIAVVTLLALYLGRRSGALDPDRTRELLEGLGGLPESINRQLGFSDAIREVASHHVHARDFLFLGRGLGYPIALEGALKLKEISYVHAEGYASGEMKHGPIALVDEGLPVMVVALQGPGYDKVLSNLEEVRARGGRIIALATVGDDRIESVAENVIWVDAVDEMLQPVVASVPLQLFAYHVADLKGTDVDQPRNLAKSVTVE